MAALGRFLPNPKGSKRSKAVIVGQLQQTASLTRKLFRCEHGNQIAGDDSHD
jgi:hypothetical protein